jgi:hypothetical protein
VGQPGDDAADLFFGMDQAVLVGNGHRFTFAFDLSQSFDLYANLLAQ